jgi:NADH-quinone oxidoreductase subunit C
MSEEERPEEQPEAKPEEVKEESAEKTEEKPAEKPKAEEKKEGEEEEPKKKKPVPKSKALDEIKKALGDTVLKAWVQRERRIYIAVKGENILDVAKTVFEMGFDHLSSISGVEYEDRMECVYHIWSYEKRELLTIRTLVSKDDPKIDSVTSIWRGANWLERETYDLVGIKFEGHPDLRRILLPDDFEGHPLRKDFELTQKPW